MLVVPEKRRDAQFKMKIRIRSYIALLLPRLCIQCTQTCHANVEQSCRRLVILLYFSRSNREHSALLFFTLSRFITFMNWLVALQIDSFVRRNKAEKPKKREKKSIKVWFISQSHCAFFAIWIIFSALFETIYWWCETFFSIYFSRK